MPKFKIEYRPRIGYIWHPLPHSYDTFTAAVDAVIDKNMSTARTVRIVSDSGLVCATFNSQARHH